MKSIDLIAAHMVGDYIFQTPEEGMNKRYDAKLRTKHVAKYVHAFVPFLIANRVSPRKIVLFTILNFISHFAADSYKYPPNPPGFPRSILIDQSIHAVELSILRRIKC